MVTLWPIQLPYGLSSYHRHVQAGNKGVALPYGEHPRWQHLTLQQLSSVALTTPSTSITRSSESLQAPAPTTPTRPRKRRKNAHDREMGVAGSLSRLSKTVTATAIEKRNKTPKPQSKRPSANPDINKTAKKKRREKKTRQKPLGPGTPPGAHHQLPIVIDSDDDVNPDEVFCLGASAVTRAYSLPVGPASGIVSRASSPTADSSRFPAPVLSVYSSSAAFRQNDPRPGFLQRTHLRHPGEQHLFEERLCSVELSPHASAATKFASQKQSRSSNSLLDRPRFQRVRSLNANPRHWKGSGLPNALASTRKPGLFANYNRTSSSAPSFADDGIELTLADIRDSDLREKTAQLMAVAPGLPVADLYHLLHEKKGRFEAAKQVISASQASSTPPSASPIVPAKAATVPLNKLIHQEDDYRDEPYIKIDLDDPAFMWDNDAPATPTPETSKRKQNTRAKSKKITPESLVRPTGRAQRLQSADTCSSKKSKKQNADPTKNKLKGIVARKSKGGYAGDINRGMRETSYDRGFIVSDDEMIGDSDDTYSDSVDGVTSDIDMNDDETDLSIDMEPEYALNADILSNPAYR